jgi:glycosyltransferase involved in cell wall biosynthesis
LIKNAMYCLSLFWSYIRIFPRLVFVSVGWPFTWFRILFLPGKKLYIQHVMPLHKLDRGNKLLLGTSLLIGKPQFISVSDFCGNKMKHFWLGKYKKLQTVYNYFEIKNHKPKVKPSRSKLQVLALARVEDGKDPFLWIEIAKKISQSRTDVQFVWAGKGSLLEESRLRCKGYDNIQFIGFVEDVDALYAASDIYFEPTKREAHGISVVGAMAWGLPVITTPNGGTVESVLDGVNGYVVDTSDLPGIEEKMKRLLDDKDLRSSMGIHGTERFEKMFTRTSWEKKMDELKI